MHVEPVLAQFAGLSRDQLGLSRAHLDAGRAAVMKEALSVIARLLGPDCLRRETDPKRSGGYLLLDGPDDNDSHAIGMQRCERVLTLAMELFDAQEIPGFDVLLRHLRTRSMYEGVAELRAVNDMCRRSDEVQFVDPGAGGPTYDAEMMFSGHRVAVEVKAKQPKPVDEYRPKLIEQTLRDARRQLPSSGPSLIYLQLISPWAEDVDVMRSVDGTIKHWLTNTGRVNGVVVMTERRFDREGGWTLSRGSAYIPNLSPHVPVAGLNDER